jgi:hypothetical protein
MASIFEKEPIFSHERPWDDTTKLPEKYKFCGRAGKAEVHRDSGALGIEFFYEKTLPDFVQAATKLNWDWYETFSQFENVLEGSYKTAWREVVRGHFSDESAIVETQNDEAGFYRAVRIFVCTILDNETPRDVQYVYLAPGGDHQIRKDLLTAPRDHTCRFKEMLRIAELLPPGETPPPSETRRAARATLGARRASVSTDDTTEVDRTAEAATIDTAPPTTDRDATDAADSTTNQNAETTTVEEMDATNAT